MAPESSASLQLREKVAAADAARRMTLRRFRAAPGIDDLGGVI